MLIYSIKDAKNKKLINLLKLNFSKINETNLISNYHPDFSNVPGNFFYILKEGRYLTGNYFIMIKDDIFYGSAGWNSFDDKALLLTRAFIPTEFRRQYLFSKHLLPIMFNETHNYKKLWITCNDYNISIYNAITRLNNGKSAGLFDQWPSIYKNFKPIGKKVVNSVEQYVLEYKRN
jgi:hypothetical protein